MDRELMQYQDRWLLSFENFCASRCEPGKSSYYSRRVPKTIHKPNGAEVKIKESHRLLWTLLVMKALDLSQSVTTIWLGREKISQLTGLSAEAVAKGMSDLAELGWIGKKQLAHKRPNQITIYLTPQPVGTEPVAEPVSLADEDMGFYTSQATLRNLQMGDNTEEPEEFGQIVELLEGQFPGHRSFSTPVLAKFLRKHLLRCVVMSHTVYRCYEVLRLTIDSTAAHAGRQAFEQMRDSHDLGKHIEASFPVWLTTQVEVLPDIE